MKIKSWTFVMILLFAALSTIYMPYFEAAYAADNKEEEIKDNMNKEIDRRLNELDLSEFEIFFQRLEDENLKGVWQSLKDIIKGIINNEQKFTIQTLIQIVLNVFLKEMVKSLPSIITIIIIAILFGVFNGLSSGFAKDSTRNIIYIVCYGAIISILSYIIASSLITVKKTVDMLDNLMSLSFPILLTLTSALGGVNSAGIYQPVMMVMTTMMIKIINIMVIPLFIATVVFGMVGNLSSSIKLDKLTKTTKSLSEWTLGIVFSIFIGYITVQGIAGAAFDTVSIKSAKFALSSYVPILGGHLSEGFDLVLASCVIIKNALGLCSIILLFFIIAAPIIKLLVSVFALRIAASIIEPMSDEKISDMLFSTSKNLITLISILLGVSFLFFVIIMLIIATCNFGVI